MAIPKPVQPVHEDDAALATLIAQANTVLGKGPAATGGQGKSLSSFPLYLLIGPEGSGKTSTFLNSGVEPQLLAGQSGPAAAPGSTRLCNLWLARNAIFVEISGRAFSGDLGRWRQLLKGLRGETPVPLWRRLWDEPPKAIDVRGVIGFCDVKELIGAEADPQRFERHCQHWQERLRAIGEVFGTEFPVYQVIAKCDAIPFFPDFFRRLPESEANQIFGCTLPFDRLNTPGTQPALPEAEAKRLTETFRLLYQAVAKRRLRQLANEPQRTLRPPIYEFPRELRRIRPSLVQFLTDVFRPHPLQSGPVLRGYYLTAIRKAEPASGPPTAHSDWATMNLDATRIFRGDATRMFSAEDFSRPSSSGGPKATVLRWMFASDLFHTVVLSDRPVMQTAVADPRFNRYRQGLFAAVCTLCLLMCTVFLLSWARNRTLLGNVQAAATTGIQKRGNRASLADLQSLDALREQLVRLRQGPGLSLHWGLYSGNRVIDAARQAYFRGFQNLLLNDLNARMVQSLADAPNGPTGGDRYDSVYRVLKTHLMISSGTCQAEPPFVSRVLKDEIRYQLAPDARFEWQVLADRQIDFYAGEFVHGNPCRITENNTACDRARQYLQNAKGIDGVYRAILANAQKTLSKPQRLAGLAPNYAKVLTGPAEMNAVFTPEGWNLVEKASKERNVSALESCVSGSTSTAGGDPHAIQQMFIRAYIEAWRKYVGAFSVVRFNGPKDAAVKLDILADHKSPLLALFAMTANQTNYPTAPEQPAIEKIPGLGDLIKKGEKAARRVQVRPPPDTLTTADIARSFQPVQWVVPPGSDPWVVEKNNAYVDSLAQLSHSMQDIADGKSTDPAIIQAANQNVEKGFEAVRQIAKGFKTEGVAGLDGEVERLLDEPLRSAKALIPGDIGDLSLKMINGAAGALCTDLKTTLHKFPFQSSSGEDAGVADLANAFAPGVGSIWKFQMKSLAELTLKEGSAWKPKDPAKSPQVTAGMLTFLNRAQSITDAFYAGGATQPQLTYTLRPRLDGAPGNLTVELEVDGTRHQWTSSLQKQFAWPAAIPANQGAVARIHNGAAVYPFASRPGVWGVFRIMGDAEPRPLGSKLVEWKYLRGGGGGRPEPMNPPVLLEIVEFPGGADLFNPKFFEGLQCPVIAVQKAAQ